MNLRFFLLPAILAVGCAGANQAVTPSAEKKAEVHIHHAEPATAAHIHHAEPAPVLTPDPVDAPAPTSVEEATRAAALAREMAGHHDHGSTTYRHIDAGRAANPDAPPPPKPDPSHHHHPEPKKEKP